MLVCIYTQKKGVVVQVFFKKIYVTSGILYLFLESLVVTEKKIGTVYILIYVDMN